MVNDAVWAGFAGTSGYLNTAAVGIPPHNAVAVLRNHLDDWATGSCDPPSFDRAVDRARRAFGELVGVDPTEVALTSCVSAVSGLVAMSMPEGAHVLCAEEDFTSVLFPFLVDQRVGVDAINRHSVGLANRLRDRIGLPPSDSAIVAVETDRGQALESAGIAASTRAGRVRLSFYLYNTEADVDLAANILAT